MLRALACDAIVLADRERELTVVAAAHQSIEREEILHRAFAERLLADDHASIVVLDRGGEDLRGARAVAIDEDRERPRVDRARTRVVEHLDVAAGLAQLNDRAAVDE